MTAVSLPGDRDQEFTLKVPDPYQSQLECTIWDESDVKVKLVAWTVALKCNFSRWATYAGKELFQLPRGGASELGEASQVSAGSILCPSVALLPIRTHARSNAARISSDVLCDCRFRGKFIEQMFYIKQGKTIETPQTATGTLKLGLRLDMGDDWPLDGPPA
eukprot:3426067-Rhodomonas_salina.3